MSVSLISSVANYLSLDKSKVLLIATEAPKTYKKYNIRKKNGGLRQIFHPSKPTKSLQYSLMQIFFSAFKIHDSAIAYRKGTKSPLLKNAKQHSHLNYTLRVDCKDFFPSISPECISKVITENESFPNITSEEISFVKNACFVRYPNARYGLAIGAPSSPIISNIIMYEMDSKISAIAKSISEESVYTRYADDFVFSTSVKNGCYTFLNRLQELLKATPMPSLEINDEKTIFSSRGTRRQITGIIITPEGRTSLGRRKKRQIRSLLYQFQKNNISVKDLKYLNGYISYILDVEPDLYNRLVIKYGGDVFKKLKES